MNIKDIKLRKGMSRDGVNDLIGEHGRLHDEIYLGNNYPHDWVCNCGNIIKNKMWSTIRKFSLIKCDKCKYKEQEERYKYEVEKDGDYEYLRSFRSGDTLPNGKIVGEQPYIQVKHKYCGSIYEVVASGFINDKKRCSKCCGSYENSFAYHIEVELGELLDKYWDFEKNTVNPYHISKYSLKSTKVWVKCIKKDYHDSFETSLTNFTRALVNNKHGCSYCHGKKVHPKDSFAQYHIDNTDKDFLAKYWSDKNTVDPWSISPCSNKNKVYIKCQEKDYHEDYLIRCCDFTKGVRCNYCACRINSVHLFDSFGYNNLFIAQSWSPNNTISPFRVAKSAGKKFEFICPECGRSYKKRIADINRSGSSFCEECSKSKGEIKISKYLRLNNINFISQKEFDGLLGVRGGNLSYDFYLPDCNLLIEYQGEYHDGSTTNQTKEEFKTQQEHDKRKMEYAKSNNIKLLEIWYYDFDNIEEILRNKLNM